MGARFESSHGEVRGTVPGGRLVGTRVVLEYPSHTATDNLLMAAVLAKGTTVIENVAKEPEAADLASMLCDMGAVVRGAGTSRIEVEGVEELRRRARRWSRPGGGRDLPGRRRHGGRRRDDCRCPARPHGDAAAQGRPDGGGDGDGPSRAPGHRVRAAGGGRRRHVALPRCGHRLQPAAGGDAHGVRRRRDPHREPVLRPVPLRGGAAPDGRGHPDRGPPCRRARGRPALRRPGAGPRHPRRCGPGPGRPGGGRGDRGQRRPPHRPRLRGPGRRVALAGARVSLR